MRTTRRRCLQAAGIGTALGVGSAATAGAQGDATVGMHTDGGDYYFDPIGLHVEPGTTVTFENVSGAHNAVAYGGRVPEGAEGFQTTVGQTAEVTLDAEGTYDFYCQPHKAFGMVGRIVVGEPGGPAAGSMPPDGDVPAADRIVEAGSVTFSEFGGGSGGIATDDLLVGGAAFGGLGLLAALVYYVVNSEGEGTRVGSREWREKEGLE
jgi:pseudoazurin